MWVTKEWVCQRRKAAADAEPEDRSLVLSGSRLFARNRKGRAPQGREAAKKAAAESGNSSATGHVYAAHIAAQLDEERSRKDTVERRAMWVVTTAGALVGLLLTVGARIPGGSSGCVIRVMAIMAVVSFIAAAGLGVAATWPRDYNEQEIEQLEEIVSSESWEQSWAEPEGVALAWQAGTNVAILKSARARTDQKANYLTAAMIFELGGVAGLAIAGVVVLTAA